MNPEESMTKISSDCKQSADPRARLKQELQVALSDLVFNV